MNKFKRLTLGTLLGGLAAGSGWKAFAHGGRNGRGMHEPLDPERIDNLRAAKLQHADAVSRRLTQALGDAAEVLTPEQRRTLAERASRWHGRWHRG